MVSDEGHGTPVDGPRRFLDSASDGISDAEVRGRRRPGNVHVSKLGRVGRHYSGSRRSICWNDRIPSTRSLGRSCILALVQVLRYALREEFGCGQLGRETSQVLDPVDSCRSFGLEPLSAKSPT